MLSSADVQRYARQILVPHVGRLGQERWLSARVEAAGEGPALDTAVELLAAAGVGIDRGDPAAPARLGELRLGETAFADRRAGCDACLRTFLESQPRAAPDEAQAVAFAVGAGVAAEILLGLLPDSNRPPIAMAFVPEPRRARVQREGCLCRA